MLGVVGWLLAILAGMCGLIVFLKTVKASNKTLATIIFAIFLTVIWSLVTRFS